MYLNGLKMKNKAYLTYLNRNGLNELLFPPTDNMCHQWQQTKLQQHADDISDLCFCDKNVPFLLFNNFK